MAVEIELPGIDPLPPPAGGYPAGQPLPTLARSPNAPKRGRRVDLNYSHAFETPAGSAASTALSNALKTSGAAQVKFYLRAPASGRGGGMTEVGEGSVSLESIMSERKDMLEMPVQLHAGSEYVGSLTVSVYALSAIKRAQAEGQPHKLADRLRD